MQRRDLVRHDLRRRAHRAEERVLVVRGPARHDQPDRRDRRDRGHVEDADVQVGGLRAPAPRDHHEGQERAHGHEQRRGHEQLAVDAAREDRLLEEQLDRVRDRLQHAVGADAHRPEPVLHEGRDLALGVHVDERRERHEVEQHQRRDGGAHERRDRPRRASSRSRERARRGSGSSRPSAPQRSISPSTMSRLPMSAITSAIIRPLARWWKTLIAVKQGLLTLSRYGLTLPSETR